MTVLAVVLIDHAGGTSTNRQRRGTGSSGCDGGNNGARGRGTDNGAKGTGTNNGAGVQAPMTVLAVVLTNHAGGTSTNRLRWRY